MKKNIDDLAVSHYWKRVFKVYEKAGPLAGLYYENASELEPKERKMLGLNYPAFIFGIFYYFRKGMFEKALMILGIGWFQGALLLLVSRIMSGGVHPSALWLPSAVICSVFANYDYYRHMVHGDVLWAQFKNFEDPRKLYSFPVLGLMAILAVVLL